MAGFPVRQRDSGPSPKPRIHRSAPCTNPHRRHPGPVPIDTSSSWCRGVLVLAGFIARRSGADVAAGVDMLLGTVKRLMRGRRRSADAARRRWCGRSESRTYGPNSSLVTRSEWWPPEVARGGRHRPGGRRSLPAAVRTAIARPARGIILLNVFVSMGTVILFIVLGVLAIASLATGVILHEGSTVAVVLTASRSLEVPDEMVRVDGGEES